MLGDAVSSRFNDLVTTLALSTLLKEAKDARELLELGSKIIEQTFYVFFSPEERDPTRNLIAAKRLGAFYTPIAVAELMASKLLAGRRNASLLDACSGAGMLAGAIVLLQESCSNGYRKIRLVEEDPQVSFWSKELLRGLSRLLRGSAPELEFATGNAAEALAWLSEGDTCSHDVIMNPPYGRMRFTSDTLSNTETKGRTPAAHGDLKRLVATQSNAMRAIFAKHKVGGGVPEASKLFLYLAGQCAKKGAAVVAITPNSWMSGKDGAPVRQLLIGERLVREAFVYKENAKLFSTVNQATCVVTLDPGEKNKLSVICVESGDVNQMKYDDLVVDPARSLQTPGVGSHANALFAKLASYPKFKEASGLLNVRGEVDQTTFKQHFLTGASPLKLVRGEHVRRFVFDHFTDEKKPGYFDPRAVESIGPKRALVQTQRIVGRQCSYARQQRRLLFTVVPEGVVVGNSCNVITAPDKNPEVLHAWVALLNSAVYDWFFRSSNSNNHVANYEIDALPAPKLTDQFTVFLARMSQSLAAAYSSGNEARAIWLEEFLEAAVCALFELTASDIDVVFGREERLDVARVKSVTRKISGGAVLPVPDERGFFNHTEPTLSHLDLLMIRAVKEGGNWQDIPHDIPSARLQQIRDMAKERGVVRTTYYGRLRRDRPSYTISTYFNRPGNGTHIHPALDRTLTSREAARLQSFPDSYVFFGTEGAVRDQIGNAVPPLLGRAIGDHLRKFVDARTCVDVFCGAGGLSLGLEAAGWDCVCAIDNNDAALQTYAFNRISKFEDEECKAGPLVLNRDLSSGTALDSAIDAVRESLAGQQLGLLAGGPPCQGFSHAGFRNLSDARNDLAVAYLAMARALQPAIFVLENVEGLLTFNKGKVAAEIVESLQELGYTVSLPVWKLAAEEYGVPQMRRRVFFVATRFGVEIQPPAAIHQRCMGRWKASSTGAINFALPEPRSVAEAFSGLSMPAVGSRALFDVWLDSRLRAPGV